MDQKLHPLPNDVRSRLRSGVAITSVSQCVEELVLNSVDAGATCIAVRLDLSCCKIQVVDNGFGIPVHSLEKVAERYTTSKCYNIQDLDENLQHYGYRGEALASIRDIASILEIQSRAKQSTHSYTRIFQNSNPRPVFECQMQRPSAGTTVTLHDLFSRLPVRKKCLNESLEIERVRSRIEGLSLIHPSISFSFRNDATGVKLLQTHKASSVLGTFTHLYGTAKARNLCPVYGEAEALKVNGYIGKEGHHNKNLQFIFVNERLVLKTKLHRMINFFLSRSSIVRKKQDNDGSPRFGVGNSSSPQRSYYDRHGIYIINITCKLSDYDITFDPSKTLIEFKNWRRIAVLVEKMVREFLLKEGLVNSKDVEVDSPDIEGLLGQDIDRDGDGDTLETDQKRGELNDVDKALSSLRKYAAGIHTVNSANNLTSETVRRPKNIDPERIVEEIIAEKAIEEKQRIASNDSDVDDPSHPPGNLLKEAAFTPEDQVEEGNGTLSTSPGDTTQDETNEGGTDQPGPSSGRENQITMSDKCNVKDVKVNSIADPPSISKLLTESEEENELEYNQQSCARELDKTILSLSGDSSDVKVTPPQLQSTPHCLGVTPLLRLKQHFENKSDSDCIVSAQKVSPKSRICEVSNREHLAMEIPDSDANQSDRGLSTTTSSESGKEDQEKINPPDNMIGLREEIQTSLSALKFRSVLKIVPTCSKNAIKPCTSKVGESEVRVEEPKLGEKALTGLQKIRKAIASRKRLKEIHAHSRQLSPRSDYQIELLPKSKCIKEFRSDDLENEKLKNYMNKDLLGQKASHSHNICVTDINNENESGNDMCSKAKVVSGYSSSMQFGHANKSHCKKPQEIAAEKGSSLNTLVHQQESTVLNSIASTSSVIGAPQIPSTSHHGKENNPQDTFTSVSTGIKIHPVLSVPESTFSSQCPHTSQSVVMNDSKNHFRKRPNPQLINTSSLPLAAKLSRLSNSRVSEEHGKVFSMMDMMLETTRKALSIGAFDAAVAHSECIEHEPGHRPISPEPSITPVHASGDILLNSDGASKDIHIEVKDIPSTAAATVGLKDYEEESSPYDRDLSEMPDRKEGEAQGTEGKLLLECGEPIEEYRRRLFGKPFPLIGTPFIPPSVTTQGKLHPLWDLGTSISNKDISSWEDGRNNVVDTITEEPGILKENEGTDETRIVLEDQSPEKQSEKKQSEKDKTFKSENVSVHQHMDYTVEFQPLETVLEKTVSGTVFSLKPSSSSPIPRKRFRFKDNISELMPSQGFTLSLNCQGESGTQGFENVAESQDCDLHSEGMVQFIPGKQDANVGDMSTTTNADSNMVEEGRRIDGNPVVETEELQASDKDMPDLKTSAHIAVDKSKDEENIQLGKGSPPCAEEKSQTSPTGSSSPVKTLFSSGSWVCKVDVNSGQKMFINNITGHSTYDNPCEPKQDIGETLAAIRFRNPMLPRGATPLLHTHTGSIEPQQQRHPTQPQASEGKSPSRLSNMFAEHKHDQNEEDRKERSIKWRSGSSSVSTSVANMFSDWDNPILKNKEQATLAIEATSSTKGAAQVQQAVHLYKFSKDMFSTIKVLGQVDNKFIACSMTLNVGEPCSAKQILAVIDQHAAHERVRLEKLTAEAFTEDGICRKQTDIEPALKVMIKEEYVRVLCAFKSRLQNVGLSFTSCDVQRDSILVHSIPSCLSERDVFVKRKVTDKVLIELIETLLKEQAELLQETNGACGTIPHVICRALNSQACHGAIKFGDPLSLEECDKLIRELSECQLPFQCAHGRPSLMPILDLNHLDKQFPPTRINPPRLWKLIDRKNLEDA